MVVKFTFQAYLVTLAEIQDTPAREVGRSHSSCILSFDLIGQHQNIKTKGFTSRKSFCHSGSQTLFFGGREATTGNASAVRRLLWIGAGRPNKCNCDVRKKRWFITRLFHGKPVFRLLHANRPFYRYGGHIGLIRFKEYYRMPRGHKHISFVFSSAFRDIFS